MVRNLAILFAFITIYGCQPTKEDGSPIKPVNVSLGSYTTAGFSQFLIPNAYAAVSDLRLCFKRLRFKKDVSDIADPLLDENVDLNLGEVAITSGGKSLSVVNIPADTYYRIEFDLEPTCAGKSAYLTNDFGVFSSSENIKIKFNGVFVVDGSETLVLGVQDILNAANAYQGTSSLRTSLESISGSF